MGYVMKEWKAFGWSRSSPARILGWGDNIKNLRMFQKLLYHFRWRASFIHIIQYWRDFMRKFIHYHESQDVQHYLTFEMLFYCYFYWESWWRMDDLENCGLLLCFRFDIYFWLRKSREKSLAKIFYHMFLDWWGIHLSRVYWNIIAYNIVQYTTPT